MTQQHTYPADRGDPDHEVRLILAAIGDRIHVPVHDAEPLRLHSNATIALPSAGLVARIASNPAALSNVASSISVTRWLAGRGFPCVVPASIDGQPFVEGGRVVSFWRLVPTKDGPPATGAGHAHAPSALAADTACPAPAPCRMLTGRG
jgi:hypothetical protein